MIDSCSIRVIPFSKQEFTPANMSGPPLFTWREYYHFRNLLLRVLQPYGTVGPMGKIPILDTWEESQAAWYVGVPNPDFFVPEDMWNQHSRWNRVEAEPWLVSTTLLHDLVVMVRDWPGWCVYLALIKGGLAISGDRILYEGDLFTGATSVEELARRCASTKSAH